MISNIQAGLGSIQRHVVDQHECVEGRLGQSSSVRKAERLIKSQLFRTVVGQEDFLTDVTVLFENHLHELFPDPSS